MLILPASPTNGNYVTQFHGQDGLGVQIKARKTIRSRPNRRSAPAGGSHEKQCLRTIPPREHGGNMDIRYLQSGVTIYLPCYIEGCGLALGDLHYAQGDGEVAGTALEMDATVTLTVEILEDVATTTWPLTWYRNNSSCPSTRYRDESRPCRTRQVCGSARRLCRRRRCL